MIVEKLDHSSESWTNGLNMRATDERSKRIENCRRCWCRLCVAFAACNMNSSGIYVCMCTESAFIFKPFSTGQQNIHTWSRCCEAVRRIYVIQNLEFQTSDHLAMNAFRFPRLVRQVKRSGWHRIGQHSFVL